MTLTPEQIDIAVALTLWNGVQPGDVVDFGHGYQRMMLLSVGKHSMKFAVHTPGGLYVHDEPRPLRRQFKVVGHIDLSMLQVAADAAKG